MNIRQRGIVLALTSQLLIAFLLVIAVARLSRAEAPIAGLPDNPLPSAYRIGPGDILAITVWKNVDLSRVATVLPDGRISLPLLGEIVAAEKTVSELQTELTQKWRDYDTNPVVTVAVKQVNSFLVYIIGKVNTPGRFQLISQTSALQALAIASGLNPFAQGDKINIFRRRHGKTVIYPFNLEEVKKGIHLEQNILLAAGDVIVVP